MRFLDLWAMFKDPVAVLADRPSDQENMVPGRICPSWSRPPNSSHRRIQTMRCWIPNSVHQCRSPEHPSPAAHNTRPAGRMDCHWMNKSSRKRPLNREKPRAVETLYPIVLHKDVPQSPDRSTREAGPDPRLHTNTFVISTLRDECECSSCLGREIGRQTSSSPSSQRVGKFCARDWFHRADRPSYSPKCGCPDYHHMVAYWCDHVESMAVTGDSKLNSMDCLKVATYLSNTLFVVRFCYRNIELYVFKHCPCRPFRTRNLRKAPLCRLTSNMPMAQQMKDLLKLTLRTFY